MVANDGVDFELRAGEIHALLGENGAGKSTLMSILVGLYRPDAGSIAIRGQPVKLRSPRQALRLGLGMVQQHFVQSERHTALQNIVLGHPDLPLLPRWGSLREQVQAVARRSGLEVALDRPLHSLPVGERQKVEILRVLYHGASILVLDEPTAVLRRQESQALFAMLRGFCQQGGAVVFISHKLDEVMDIAQRVTVLRRGRRVCTRSVQDLDATTLAGLMVGEQLELSRRSAAREPGAEVLRLDAVRLDGPGRRPVLEGVSVALYGGEILGIAGVSGSGQEPLAELLAGLRRPASGSMSLLGQPAPVGSPRAFRELGVAYVPADRNRTGVAGSLSVAENLVLKNHERFAGVGMMRWRAARSWARERIQAHGIQCTGAEAKTASLSGGNVQKVILARELALHSTAPRSSPGLLVAAYPCRGLDVGAAEAVRSLLLRARDSGSAVVLFSEDLDELFRLADRLAVLFRGRLLGARPVEQLEREQVGLMMGGQALEPAVPLEGP